MYRVPIEAFIREWSRTCRFRYKIVNIKAGHDVRYIICEGIAIFLAIEESLSVFTAKNAPIAIER